MKWPVKHIESRAILSLQPYCVSLMVLSTVDLCVDEGGGVREIEQVAHN